MIGAVGRYSNLFGPSWQGYTVPAPAEEENKPILNPGEDEQKSPGRKSSPAECETCRDRKYQDGSDESDVSFQTAQHIDPAAAGARVRAHEQEHVVNAYEKAEENDGKVISVGVSLHSDICPECGRVYVSGGETRSTIAYKKGGEESGGQQYREDPSNPYRRQSDSIKRMLNTGINASFMA